LGKFQKNSRIAEIAEQKKIMQTWGAMGKKIKQVPSSGQVIFVTLKNFLHKVLPTQKSCTT